MVVAGRGCCKSVGGGEKKVQFSAGVPKTVAERLHVNSAGRNSQLLCFVLLFSGLVHSIDTFILSSSSYLTRVTIRLLHDLSLPPYLH